jgi:hypothetical protein
VGRELSTELREAARRSLATSLALFPQIQLEATERLASPAAGTTEQARRLADDINAIRGRVHAVVMWQLLIPPHRTRSLFLSRARADAECRVLASWVDSTLPNIQLAARMIHTS